MLFVEELHCEVVIEDCLGRLEGDFVLPVVDSSCRRILLKLHAHIVWKTWRRSRRSIFVRPNYRQVGPAHAARRRFSLAGAATRAAQGPAALAQLRFSASQQRPSHPPAAGAAAARRAQRRPAGSAAEGHLALHLRPANARRRPAHAASRARCRRPGYSVAQRAGPSAGPDPQQQPRHRSDRALALKHTRSTVTPAREPYAGASLAFACI